MIATDLMKRGFRIAKPLSHELKYDLIAISTKDVFYRVQCKYTTSKGASVSIKCRRTGKHTTTHYKSCDVDWLACFDVTTNRVYYVPGSMLGPNGRNEIRIRLLPSKNKQHLLTNWWEDYIDPPASP